MASYYNGISVISAFPNETLNVNLSASTTSINSNSIIRFTKLFKRGGNDGYGDFTEYFYVSSIPSTKYATRSEPYIINLPTNLEWNVGKLDTFASIDLSTSDSIINVIPTRTIPDLLATSSYYISGGIKVYNKNVILTDEVLEEDENLALYLSGTGTTSATLVWSNSGLIHRNRVDDDTFLTFGASPPSTWTSSIGKRLGGLSLKLRATNGTTTYRVDLLADKTDVNKLISKEQGSGSDFSLGVNVITGTVDYDTGDWSISFNTLSAVPSSTISASYLIIDDDLPVSTTLVSNIVGQNFTLSSDRPIYLFPIDFYLSSGSVSSEFGFCIEFDAYASVSGNYTDTISATPLMRDRYQKITLPLTDDSKYRLLEYSEQNVTITKNDGSSYTPVLVDSEGEFPENEGWLNGTNVPLKFERDEYAFDNFNYTLQVSSINENISEYVIQFYSNTANANINLYKTYTSPDETSYRFSVTPDIEISDSSNIRFNVEPSDVGIVLKDCSNNAINVNTNYPYSQVSCVNVYNVGLGTTNLLVSAVDYNLEGLYPITTSFPTSSYTFGYTLSASNGCKVSTSNFYASCWFSKNNIKYPPPFSEKICWLIESDTNINTTITATNRDSERINLNTCLPSYRNDKIELAIRPETTVSVSPSSYFYRLKPRYVEENYVVEADSIKFEVKDFPSFNVNFSALSASVPIYNTLTSTGVPLLTGSYTFDFNLDIENTLFNYSLSNITWNVEGTLYSGVSSITGITLSSNSNAISCVSLSVNDITLGNWGYPLCFVNKMCFHFKSSKDLDFIVFPENQFYGSSGVKLTFDNYSTFLSGNTAYDRGHVETFYISAERGYDKYDFKINDILVSKESFPRTSATDCRTTINFGSVDVLSSYIVSVSAYDYDVSTTIPAKTGVTDNSTVFKQNIQFVDYPDFQNYSYVDNNVLNLKYPNGGLFTLSLAFSALPSPVQVVNGIVYMTLSSESEEKEVEFNVNSNITNEVLQFTKKRNDFYRIKRNTFNTFNLVISGDIGVKIPEFQDSFIQTQSANVVIIPLSVYDGPYPDIYVESTCVSSNEVVTIYNTTSSFPALSVINFSLDVGNNTPILTASTASTPFTALYTTEGSYTLSLTGYIDGNPVVTRFPNYINVDCGSNCSPYDETIDREFPSTLEYPWSLDNLKLKPNERLTHHNFNSCVDMFFDNLDYLISNSKIYSPTAPSELLRQTLYEDIGKDAIDFKLNEDKLFLILEDKIKIIDVLNIRNVTLDDEERIDTLVESDSINEYEKFTNIKSLDVKSDGSQFVLIDDNFVLVFDYDGNTDYKLVEYWGGPNSRESKTGLSNPTCLTFDGNDNLYVGDYDNYIVKKYNKFYHWISNIDHDDFLDKKLKPISLAGDSDDNLFILLESETSEKIVYVFDETGEFTTSFNVVDSAYKIFVNLSNSGIVYVFANESVFKYTKSGYKINKFIQPVLEPEDVQIGIDQNGDYLIYLTKDYVYDLYDCFEIQTIRDESFDDIMWSRESVYMDKNEFIQDFSFNDSFNKIFQNYEIFKRSLSGKFITYNDYFDPELIKHSIASLESADLTATTLTSTYVGINEFVSYDVLNREIENLYNHSEIILSLIQSRTRTYDSSCDTICWRWDALSTKKASIAPNCDIKPISWVELESYGITDWSLLSCDDCEPSYYKDSNYILSAVGNQAPTTIEDCEFDTK